MSAFRPDAEMFVCMDPTGCYHVSWNEAEHRAKMAQVGATDEARYARSLSEQKPVAYRVHGLGWDEHLSAEQALQLQSKVPGLDYTPLYASPQPEAVITEEMVERGARKLAEMDLGWGDPPGVVKATVDVRWMEYAATSRAALTAALKEA